MEESSAKEVREGSRGIYNPYGPCYFLQEALRAILKCLGLESTTPASASDEQKHNNKANQTTCHESPSSTPDPPSTSQVPAGLITFEDAPSISALAMPPRPPISSGSGPQTN